MTRLLVFVLIFQYARAIECTYDIRTIYKSTLSGRCYEEDKKFNLFYVNRKQIAKAEVNTTQEHIKLGSVFKNIKGSVIKFNFYKFSFFICGEWMVY